MPWSYFNRRILTDSVVTREEMFSQRTIAYWKYGRAADQFAISAGTEKREYDLYRRGAFGPFGNLLESCAKSVAMIIYLNTYENT